MSKNIAVIIDAGHGGIGRDGIYQTLRKNSNRWQHPDGWAYEGVINRKIAEALETQIKAYDETLLPDEREVLPTLKVLRVYKADIDTPLHKRIENINSFVDMQRSLKPAFKPILISIHGNASADQKQRGYECWVCKGASQESRTLAEGFAIGIKDRFPDAKYRSGKKGVAYRIDSEWRSPIAILRASICPAILTENLFFDNAEDWKLLQDEAYIWKIAQAHLQAIRYYAYTLTPDPEEKHDSDNS